AGGRAKRLDGGGLPGVRRHLDGQHDRPGRRRSLPRRWAAQRTRTGGRRMTTSVDPIIEQQLAFADHLVGAVVHDATGEADGDRCIGEPPSARYYLATLAPRDLDLSAGRERRGRQTPGSAGFEFEVVDDRASLDVRATLSCYCRVLPTFEEQLGFA